MAIGRTNAVVRGELKVKTGTFQPTGAATVTISNVGFVPKYISFYCTSRASGIIYNYIEAMTVQEITETQTAKNVYRFVNYGGGTPISVCTNGIIVSRSGNDVVLTASASASSTFSTLYQYTILGD